MWQVTLRGIRAQLGRFFLTALSVMLGIAFLSGTLAFRDVLGQTFSNLSSGTIVSDLTVRGEPIESDMQFGGSNAPLSASLADDIAAIDGVDGAYPTYAGNAIIIGADGQPANLAQAPALGFGWTDETDTGSLLAGRAPQAAHEVVLEEGTAETADLDIGDTAVLLTDAEPLDVDVVGIVSYGSSTAGASVTLLEPEFAKESFSPNGTVAEIGVIIAEGTDPEPVTTAIEESIPDVVVLTADEVRAETEEAVASILDMINTFLLVFVALALGIGIFIITNTFRISVRQRQKEFALLRAIGAAPRQVFGVVFGQAIIIGLLGSALGVLLGQGLILAIRVGLEAWGLPLDAELIMTPTIVTTAIIIGVIITVIAALLPARSAALTPPIEAMRETSGATEKPLKIRTIIGLLTVAAGAAAFTAGAMRTVAEAGWALGLGALFVVVGLIIVSPALVRPTVTVLGWPIRRWSPVLGKVASESTAASPRKTASTASALMIGVALVAMGATLASSVKASLNDVIESSVTSDLLVMTNIPINDPSAGIAAMEQVDGVQNIDDSVRYGMAYIPSDTPETITVTSLSNGSIDALGLEVIDGDVSAFGEGKLALHESEAASEDLAVGDELMLMGPEGPTAFEVGAIISSEIVMSPIYVSQETFSSLQIDSSFVGALIIDVEEGYNISEVKNEIIAEVEEFYIFQVLDQEDLKGMVGQSVDMILTVLYALLGLSIVIAALGIVNTLSLSVSDRTREIGLLRAVGLSRLGVRGSILIESIIISILGAVIGIITGVPLAIGLTDFVADDSQTIIAIPWVALATMLGLAVIVGALASILPARRAARLDVLKAIATE